MTLAAERPANVALSIGRESRPEPAGDISSLRNSWGHSTPEPVDTVSLPTVGISVQEHKVSVSIESSKDVMSAKWLEQTAIALVQLVRLPRDWNSYNPVAIAPRAIESMLAILLVILDDDSTAPTVVPTSRGGVQVEWHQNGIDFEIESLSAGGFEFFFSGPEGEDEGVLPADPAILKPIVQRLKDTSSSHL